MSNCLWARRKMLPQETSRENRAIGRGKTMPRPLFKVRVICHPRACRLWRASLKAGPNDPEKKYWIPAFPPKADPPLADAGMTKDMIFEEGIRNKDVYPLSGGIERPCPNRACGGFSASAQRHFCDCKRGAGQALSQSVPTRAPKKARRGTTYEKTKTMP